MSFRPPVFVTYRDRRSMLDRCLASLRHCGFEDVTVIDNDSAEPLEADWFKVVKSDNSHRQLAPWLLDIIPKDEYYIVTDCDLELDPDCPTDLADHLLGILERHPEVVKIGPGLRTDDLLFPPPDHYAYSYLMEYSVERGTRFKKICQHLDCGGTIDAPIDTTFALHRPGSGWPGIVGARTVAPYLARHLPWYNPVHSEEERLYYSRVGKAWTMGHAADNLLEMDICVPFATLRAETVIALAGKEVRYAPRTTDESYFELFRDMWQAGKAFTNIEQDIVVTETTLDELRICENDWCAMPYPYRNDTAFSMACCKFSAEIIARHPDLPDIIEQCFDELHPPRHWCRLDAWIYQTLTALGERRCDHKRSVPVGHIGAQWPSHGCLGPKP